jgi:hypothetical protein
VVALVDDVFVAPLPLLLLLSEELTFTLVVAPSLEVVWLYELLAGTTTVLPLTSTVVTLLDELVAEEVD